MASHVPQGAALADIGSDHGFLPLALLCEGRIRKAIAGDILSGPMDKAREKARSLGFPEDQASFRLGDGLGVLRPGEADCLVIAGMGADLLTRILKAHKEILASFDTCIFSPHTKPWLLRSWACEHGLALVKEEVLQERKRFYEIQVYTQGHKKMTPYEAYFGPYLLSQMGDPVVKAYFAWRKKGDRARMQGLLQADKEDLQALEDYRTLTAYWERKERNHGKTL